MSTKNKEKSRLTRSEAGKLGALALNADPKKKKAAILKAAETRKAKNAKAKER